jgi:hypothetical protein
MYLKAGFVCSRQDEVTTRLSLGELFRLECGTVKQLDIELRHEATNNS